MSFLFGAKMAVAFGTICGQKRLKKLLGTDMSKPASVPIEPTLLQAGDRISVYWTGEKQHFSGTVHGTVEEDGVLLHTIHYDDGEIRHHDMTTEEWVKLDGEGNAQAEASVKAVLAQTQASYHLRNTQLTAYRHAEKQAVVAAMYMLAWASEYGDDFTAMDI